MSAHGTNATAEFFPITLSKQQAIDLVRELSQASVKCWRAVNEGTTATNLARTVNRENQVALKILAAMGHTVTEDEIDQALS